MSAAPLVSSSQPSSIASSSPVSSIASSSQPSSSVDLDGDTLPQQGNPINGQLDNYEDLKTGSLEGDKLVADAMIAYQLPVGGFRKERLTRYLDGIPTPETVAADHENARNLGSIDNESTTTEFMFLVDIYKRTQEAKYKEAARRVMDYFFEMQSDTGGFPQFYPDRGKNHYSNHATFNDGAMVRVLIALKKAVDREPPFDTDIFSDEQIAKIDSALQKSVDFILRSQIVDDGLKTVWCAQHDMETYEPRTARSYELPSKSGSESVMVTAFLMSYPQTPEVKAAVEGALNWFRSPDTYLANHTYDKSQTGEGVSPIVFSQGSRVWYRFYDLDTNEPMFVNRDGMVFHDITLIPAERKDNYRWGGNWGESIIRYADSVGY